MMLAFVFNILEFILIVWTLSPIGNPIYAFIREGGHKAMNMRIAYFDTKSYDDLDDMRRYYVAVILGYGGMFLQFTLKLTGHDGSYLYENQTLLLSGFFLSAISILVHLVEYLWAEVLLLFDDTAFARFVGRIVQSRMMWPFKYGLPIVGGLCLIVLGFRIHFLFQFL